MISLLFYVLYPISRYVTSRHSESLQKDPPPAQVHGKAAWDGGAVATRSFAQCQSSLLAQGPNPSPSLGTKQETKERMKEPSPGQEDDTRPVPEEEHLGPVPRGEAKGRAASTLGEGRSTSTEKEAETRNALQQDKGEAPTQNSGELTIHHQALSRMQNTEDVIISPAADIGPEKAVGVQLDCLQPVGDSTLEATSPIKMPSLEEFSSPAEQSVQETTRAVKEQTPMPCADALMAPAKTAAEVTECWDEYVTLTADEMVVGESGSELAFPCLFSNTQSPLNLSGKHSTQTGWHFPAGPGLAEEVHCPLWQFPVSSYYPPVEAPGPFEVNWRVWEETDESATAAEASPPFTTASMDLTVMSYNVLAQDLLEANGELYTHCPLEVLDWSNRCRLLLDEIQKWKPDILCLQEVQENHYHQQLCPVLSDMGYTCVFKRRTGTKTDGCATCYRSSGFSEVSVATLEFFKPEVAPLDRHNVAIVLLLRPVFTEGSEVKARGLPLCVANTHLLFNPRRGDVKLAQLAVMLAEIDRVVKSCKAKGEDCNIILCGDFNSVPQKPLYQLITTGELYFQGLPAWMISGQEELSEKSHCRRLYAPLWSGSLGVTDGCQYTTAEDAWKSRKSGKYQYSYDFLLQQRFCPAACLRPAYLEVIRGVTDNTPGALRGPPWSPPCEKKFGHTVSHRFDLQSVYKHILPGFGNPEVTTLHSEGAATVDYIFYTPKRASTCDQNPGDLSAGLKLIGSLSLLSEDVLWSLKGLPNHMFPSDHLSLLAKFRLDLNAA
uniref:protein angel homolog 1 isoform X2 n=1 Tax=Gasterosteus aculeatus aculeatus TaxID=481459 RepID=UPI001A9800A8|nr:protein angel homolog 1 isoform X2 [Gasterosteus aculeatus aculeatus]